MEQAKKLTPYLTKISLVGFIFRKVLTRTKVLSREEKSYSQFGLQAELIKLVGISVMKNFFSRGIFVIN